MNEAVAITCGFSARHETFQRGFTQLNAIAQNYQDKHNVVIYLLVQVVLANHFYFAFTCID